MDKRKQMMLGQGSLNVVAHSSSYGESRAKSRVGGWPRGRVHLFRGEFLLVVSYQ